MISGLLVSSLLLSMPASFAAETVRGVVKSQARIEIVSDLSALVADLPVKAGDQFWAGDTLIAFDCSLYAAELRAARAAAAAADADRKQKLFLFKNGAGGRGDADIAAAQAEKAAADIAVVEARMQGCSVSVPFAGRVVDVATQVSERPLSGQPLMTVINSDALEIELIIPSRWLRHVSVGTAFSFTVDETGTRHEARLVRIGAEVDPVSQTIPVWASFDDPQGRVLSGMSGDAAFSIDVGANADTDPTATGALR